MKNSKNFLISLSIFLFYVGLMLLFTKCNNPITPEINIEQKKEYAKIIFIKEVEELIWMKTSHCKQDKKFIFPENDSLYVKIHKSKLPIIYYFKIMHHAGGDLYFTKRKVIYNLNKQQRDTIFYIR